MNLNWTSIPLCLVAGALLATPAGAQYGTTRVASGLTRPTLVTAAPGDVDRVFVLEQRGVIRIIRNGTLLARPFLDIEATVNDGGNEQGLLGLAFDPNYATNGNFFVYLTGGTGSGTSQIRRYTVTSDPDSADVLTALRIFTLTQPSGQTNHKGGTIAFRSDSYLYVGLGDGGGAGDTGNRAQNGLELLGKMLRIDVNGDDFPADANNNYSIPPTNPFISDSAVRDEIWAIGMRNPYRWSFDRANDDLYIGDVGQGEWEEVDYEPATFAGGRNYGWRLMEGNHCFNPSVNCDDGSPVLTYPVHEFPHFPAGGGFNCSITGGVVYRGSALPDLQGHYLFADFCSDEIWSIKMVGGVATEFTDRRAQITPLDGFTAGDLTSIGEDANGEIYFTDRGAGTAGQGEVFKLVADPAYTGVTGPISPVSGAALQLSRVAPNPFRGSTSFDVQLAERGEVQVDVYSATGQFVKTVHRGTLGAGSHSLAWSGDTQRGEPVAAGIYFLRAKGLGLSATKSVTVLR